MACKVVYEIVGANGQKIREHAILKDVDTPSFAIAELEKELHTVVNIISCERI